MIRRSDRGGVYDAIQKAAKTGNLPDELKPKGMKTYNKVRSLKEVETAVRERGWKWDSSKHDNEGLDHIRIDFIVGKTIGMCLFASFNGKFLGQLADGTSFSSDNTTHDGTDWFKALLETFYE